MYKLFYLNDMDNKQLLSIVVFHNIVEHSSIELIFLMSFVCCCQLFRVILPNPICPYQLYSIFLLEKPSITNAKEI